MTTAYHDNRRTTPSYGAVVIEQTDAGPVVLLCDGYHGMSFPKGHIEPGEKPDEAAVREVLEETGIEITVDTSFARTVKSALERDERTVTFFIGRSCVGTAAPTPQIEEVRSCAWMPVGEALKAIVFEPDRKVLEDALSELGIPF